MALQYFIIFFTLLFYANNPPIPASIVLSIIAPAICIGNMPEGAVCLLRVTKGSANVGATRKPGL